MNKKSRDAIHRVSALIHVTANTCTIRKAMIL